MGLLLSCGEVSSDASSKIPPTFFFFKGCAVEGLGMKNNGSRGKSFLLFSSSRLSLSCQPALFLLGVGRMGERPMCSLMNSLRRARWDEMS